MAYTLAPALCSRLTDVSPVKLPFDVHPDVTPGEEIVGFTAVTEDCTDHLGYAEVRHVKVTGWLVVSTSTLSWFDNDGMCYRQRMLHPIGV